MRVTLLISMFLVVLSGCKKDGDTYITNVTSPDDWQPPVVTWITFPESELRGTVGIDVNVTDSSAIETVTLYIDGVETASFITTPYRFEIVTDALEDDVHLLEARAWDEFGNMGVSTILRVRVMNSFAQGPRLIWVPDSFATIQAAINAATDFDTIRVRDGAYYESLNLFGKGIWLESESGPIGCEVNVRTGNNALYAPASRDLATVRGLHFSNGYYTVYFVDGSRVKFVNNIVTSDTAETLLLSSYGGGELNNNLFSHSRSAIIQMGYHWGTLYNNIVQQGGTYGLWNAALSDNPIEYGYNLLWQNASNYSDRFDPGTGDVYDDPLLNLSEGFLGEGSAAIDAGNPEIFDLDGTRSDIGPFGGPYAYTNTEGQN
jgi:hypothetical protein